MLLKINFQFRNFKILNFLKHNHKNESRKILAGHRKKTIFNLNYKMPKNINISQK